MQRRSLIVWQIVFGLVTTYARALVCTYSVASGSDMKAELSGYYIVRSSSGTYMYGALMCGTPHSPLSVRTDISM